MKNLTREIYLNPQIPGQRWELCHERIVCQLTCWQAVGGRTGELNALKTSSSFRWTPPTSPAKVPTWVCSSRRGIIRSSLEWQCQPLWILSLLCSLPCAKKQLHHHRLAVPAPQPFLVQQNRMGHKNMSGRLRGGALSAVFIVTTITEFSLGSRPWVKQLIHRLD